jgi:hypothetical protein
VPSAPGWAAANSGEVAQAPTERGLASEARVLKDIGETKNTASVTGKEGSSIPDFQNSKTIGEVKDVKAVSNTKQLKATALVFDVSVDVPETAKKSDAIQVCVEHVDGYSAEIFFPYEIQDGRLNYGVTFAQEGKREIFGKS